AQADKIGVVENVVVREGGALRKAGGAGGVLDVDGVVELQLGFAALYVGFGNRVAHLVEALPFVVNEDRACQRETTVAHLVENRNVLGLAKAFRQKQRAHACLVEDIFQFHGFVSWVNVDQNGAHASGSVLKDDPLEAV